MAPTAGAKGGPLVGITRRGKATKVMAVADGSGLPLAIGIESGQRNEQKLVVPTLRRRFLKELPKRLIGDRAYDCDPLDAELAKMGIEMISPHHSDPLDAELAKMGTEMISPHHPGRRRKTQAPCAATDAGGRWSASFCLDVPFQTPGHSLREANFLGLLQLACAQILWGRL